MHDERGGFGWVRDRPTPVQVRRDALLGAGLTAAALVMVELLRATPAGAALNDRLLESYLWAVAIALPLTVRRLLPVTVMVVCALAFYVMGERVPSAALSVVVQVCFFMAIYTAWAWSRRRRLLLVATVAVVLGMFAWLIQLLLTEDIPTAPGAGGLFSSAVAFAIIQLGINVVYFLGAIAWGQVANRGSRQRHELHEQSEALRREQQVNAERAVTDERLRIARDLHDVVAHHVTGIGVQAAAARHVLERDPAGSSTALAAIEDSSRSAVREMHQLVGLLRDGAEAAGQPTLSAVRDLAQSGTQDGLRVAYREVGEPFPVPGSVGTSAYRTVQEALTNVHRHSTAHEAEVVLRYLDEPGAVEVEVLDAGHPVEGGSPSPGRGLGLQGIRERVGLHAGECEIGPRPDRGFRVRVRLPVDPARQGAT